MSEHRIPQRGDFQSFGLSGSFAPSAEAVISTRPYFGLEPEGSYFWGTFRDEDGGVYIFMRRVPFGHHVEPPRGPGAPATIGRRSVLFHYPDGGPRELAVHPASFASGYNTQMRIERDGDTVRFQSDPDNRGKPFHAYYRPDHVELFEQDMIAVSGASLTPGLHWHIPGREVGIYYASQTWKVTGTAAGKPVAGFLFLEQAYMAEGGVLYAIKDVLVGEEAHLTWYSFATEYDDGETQFGHFIVGHDRLGIGVVSNQQGLIVQSSTVAARVTRSAGGYWSDRVDLDVDGEAWEIIQPPDLRIHPTSHTPNGQQEGMIRRVGETRTPRHWMAWGETVPGHGDERRTRFDAAFRLCE